MEKATLHLILKTNPNKRKKNKKRKPKSYFVSKEDREKGKGVN